jgi:hypothetical protein
MIHVQPLKLTLLLVLLSIGAYAQPMAPGHVQLVPVAEGWAKNSVNAVVFRKDPLLTAKGSQYIAFYDGEGRMVLGKRKSGSADWTLETTPYKGRVKDAHNSISLGMDGKGYLHVAWDHHATQLRYCKSKEPYSLELTEEMPMTGKKEVKVTYPQFYNLPNGDLIFLYRDGISSNGDLVLNHYDVNTEKWEQRQANLIDGEGNRNAYWQMAADKFGTLHLSWVWRERVAIPTAGSNHDIGYARSRDGGMTWEKTTGEKYRMPIIEKNTEHAMMIPQNSDLINQTSMSTDDKGNPYIAIYWRLANETVPQYRIVYYDGKSWHMQQASNRKTPFSLSGRGTIKIPISRPQLMIYSKENKNAAVMIFRDEERGNRVSVSMCTDISKSKWKTFDLTNTSVDQWEPSYDSNLWNSTSTLNLFVQKVQQANQEGLAESPPTMVSVLEWKP